jgi:hypothetical protein
MIQRPLHLKRSLERLALAGQPTERHTVVRLPRVTEKLSAIEPLLPLDGLCRPYLVSFVRWDGRGLLWDDTIYHVWRLVDDYYRHSKGRYPTEIVLPAQRYFVRRCNRFYPMVHSARPIPFKYEDCNAPYEVLVRGEA